MQSAASPAAAVALARSNALIDTRELLPSIRVPTLVLSRRDDPVGPEPTGRYLAERIPDARFVPLEGDEHLPWLGDAEALCAEIEHFVTGVRPTVLEPGVVRAILLVDLEGSTRLVHTIGDERWADLLTAYGDAADRAVNTRRPPGRPYRRRTHGCLRRTGQRCSGGTTHPSGGRGPRPPGARRRTHGRSCRARRSPAGSRRPSRRTRDGERCRGRGPRLRHGQGHRRRLRAPLPRPRNASTQRRRGTPTTIRCCTRLACRQAKLSAGRAASHLIDFDEVDFAAGSRLAVGRPRGGAGAGAGRQLLRHARRRCWSRTACRSTIASIAREIEESTLARGHSWRTSTS